MCVEMNLVEHIFTRTAKTPTTSQLLSYAAWRRKKTGTQGLRALILTGRNPTCPKSWHKERIR